MSPHAAAMACGFLFAGGFMSLFPILCGSQEPTTSRNLALAIGSMVCGGCGLTYYFCTQLAEALQ